MEYVLKLIGQGLRGASADLSEMLEDFRYAAPRSMPGEVRDVDHADCDAIAERLVHLRDVLALPDAVSFHACRHDEGVGDCTAAVEIR